MASQVNRPTCLALAGGEGITSPYTTDTTIRARKAWARRWNWSRRPRGGAGATRAARAPPPAPPRRRDEGRERGGRAVDLVASAAGRLGHHQRQQHPHLRHAHRGVG